MRHALAKVGSLAAAVLLSLSFAQPSQAGETHHTPTRAAAAATEPAYFEMKTYGGGDAFVLELQDADKIDHARRILNGEERESVHVIGRIKKSTASYNPNWGFHLDPKTVSFFEVAIEVCDATLPYVQNHLDEVGGAFLPGSYYCPWSSRLVREVPAQ